MSHACSLDCATDVWLQFITEPKHVFSPEHFIKCNKFGHACKAENIHCIST